MTNKHVIRGDRYFENSKPEINRLILRLHTDPQDLSRNEDICIPLCDGGREDWLEHENPDVDVVLVPLNNIDQGRYVIMPTDSSSIDSSGILVGFEQIFVMGYPYGWYDKANNLPVARVGHLASPFRVPFQGKPIMLGDVETHPGMSGGPVFMKLKDYVTIDSDQRTKHLGAEKLVLVGIHSGQPRWDLVDQRTGSVTETISHSLIHIWSSDLILEICANNPSADS